MSANLLLTTFASLLGWAAAWLSLAIGDGSAPGAAVWLATGVPFGALLSATLALPLWRWAAPVADPTLAAEWRGRACTTFIGVLLMAPLIESFASFRVKRSGGMSAAQFAFGGVALLLFFGVSALIFSNDVSDEFGASLGPTLMYLPLPFLIVTALI